MNVESTVDDGALVGLASRGDHTAYGELVRRHQFDALRVARGIAGPADAEDAAQEAFVRAFRALGKFDQTRPFRPWLMAIVANTARNHRRAKHRWERSSITGGKRQLAAQPSAASAEDVTLNDSMAELTGAIERLPRGQRDVITCRYLMDLSEEETAITLGVPRGTVKSRLARGLTGLEQLIHRESPP